ncbi:ParB/RepB/Spo0J family partition protein [Nisaea acidiphila]|uniref:ParB/RepB/Spo0J family partition protein n=1 Tax=Nisaea acidiphila TaxID=1862145 RepID=A0A9J7AYT0_9PROT|nr:ParB/RepB/Spo0J family partition protein [Nisaea acidiphila]UUX52230.1 ParB/RepB/Spo0J family partition protein [Nisaea acidiphila]
MENGSAKNRRLGRGLASLLGEDAAEGGSVDRLQQSRAVPIEKVHPGRFQPRRVFDEAELDALADSVREKGVIQPILLRRDPDREGTFEIIAGERRWRAAQRAQLHEIPAHIREFDDREALEIAIIENVQREDLNPLEEAEGYHRLVEEHGHSQQEVAKAVGKSRSHIANTMRLLALPTEVRGYLDAGEITAGHARALLTAENPAALAAEVVRRKLNVRETERLVQKEKQPTTSGGSRQPRRKGSVEKDADTRALENDLSQKLGMHVEIASGIDGQSGALMIRYESLEQLDALLAIMSAPRTVAADLGSSAMTGFLADVPDYDQETADEIAKADGSSIDFSEIPASGDTTQPA